MYVDCDAATVAGGVLLLRKLGHAVIAAANEDVAVEVFAREPVNAVILCDSLKFARQDLARQMQMLKPHVPILLTNGAVATVHGSPPEVKAEPIELLLTSLLGGNAAASAEG